jgi:hypothetical protein
MVWRSASTPSASLHAENPSSPQHSFLFRPRSQPHCGVKNSLRNSLFYDVRGIRNGVCGSSFVVSGCEGGWRFPNNTLVPAPFAASFQGNIFVPTQCTLFDTRAPGFWPNPGPGYPGSFADSNYSADRNVFFAPPGALPLRFPLNYSLTQWRAVSGNDLTSVIADPLLKDPARGDFTVLPDSPAWALGWHAIDTSSVGPR